MFLGAYLTMGEDGVLRGNDSCDEPKGLRGGIHQGLALHDYIAIEGGNLDEPS